jgi:hypothetical protein
MTDIFKDAKLGASLRVGFRDKTDEWDSRSVLTPKPLTDAEKLAIAVVEALQHTAGYYGDGHRITEIAREVLAKIRAAHD